MTNQEHFFSELLGVYWDSSLNITKSLRRGYTYCVYIGDECLPDKNTVLHLNLKKKTALYDQQMSWMEYAGGGFTRGNAWDDNQPDSGRIKQPFEDWVTACLHMLIQGIARMASQNTIEWLSDDRPKTPADWQLIDERLRDVREGLGERADDWSLKLATSADLAMIRAAIEVGDDARALELVQSFDQNMSNSDLASEQVQALLAPIMHHHEERWCQIIQEPLAGIAANKPADGSPTQGQYRTHQWLIAANSPVLMEFWVSRLVQTGLRPEALVRYARQIPPGPLARAGVQFFDYLISELGDHTDNLAFLAPLLRSAGDDERAAQVEAKLALFGYNADMTAKAEELMSTRYAMYRMRQLNKGGIPIEELERITRALELEEEINAYWRAQREDQRARHLREQRFVCWGSTAWICMWGHAQEFERAIERFEYIFADWDFVEWLHASECRQIETLVEVGTDVIFASGLPGPIERARALLERVHQDLPAPSDCYVHLHYAETFARFGQAEYAVEHLSGYADWARKKGYIDHFIKVSKREVFDGVREHPQFLALIESVAT